MIKNRSKEETANPPLPDCREQALPDAAALLAAVVVGPILLLVLLDGRTAG